MKIRFTLHQAKYLIALVLVAGGSLVARGDGTLKLHKNNSKEGVISAETAIKWGKMTLRTMKNTPGNTPTYGSRAVGYMGLTMYESVVCGTTKCKSMEGQLAGFNDLPKPDKTQKYNWILSLNAGQAFMLKQLYEQTAAVNKAAIDSLENAIYQAERLSTSQEIADRSTQYGLAIAKTIFEWSKKDGGFQGYKHNFDSTYKFPVGTGYWKAPAKGQSPIALPLHPYWGKNRTFAPANGVLPVPKIIPFDYKKDSDYYAQFYEVYSKGISLTQEEKEIASWWGDDPSATFSPPGHSYNLATIALQNAEVNLFKAAEAYARVGMAVADAFINCWKCKYTYHAERPYNYIYFNITTLWDLYWPEPPFPAFYSGHAGQAAAAAMVLTEMFGDHFKFTDNSHVGRPMDRERMIEFKARHFNSFWEAAQESANSRLYGGIHTCQDNEVGLTEGRKIGSNINALAWRN